MYLTRSCDPIDLPKLYRLYWIPILSFEVILFALALFKGLEYLEMYRSWSEARTSHFAPLQRLGNIFRCVSRVLYLAVGSSFTNDLCSSLAYSQLFL